MNKCGCKECEITAHDADCSVHNGPAMPKGDCDCVGEKITQGLVRAYLSERGMVAVKKEHIAFAISELRDWMISTGCEDDDSVLENTIKDLASGLLYYDRKEDEQLPRGEIENMIKQGETSGDAIAEAFKKELFIGLGAVYSPPHNQDN